MTPSRRGSPGARARRWRSFRPCRRPGAKELLRSEIYTIEQLASLEGDRLARLGMGARTLKDLAVDWVSRRARSPMSPASRPRTRNCASGWPGWRATAARELGRAMNGGEKQKRGEIRPAGRRALASFQPWADEDIVNWIVDNGGEKPHHNCSHATLVGKADDLNAEIASRNKARAA